MVNTQMEFKELKTTVQSLVDAKLLLEEKVVNSTFSSLISSPLFLS